MGAAGQEHEDPDHRRGHDQAERDHHHRLAAAQREPPPLARGQRPQHGGHLAGDVARAGGLDGQHVLQVGDELGVIGVALVQALGGGGVHHRGQRGRDLRALELDVGDRLAHVLHRHRDLALAGERDLAGEHLVEDDAQRVQVRLPGDVLAERLLGRDVVRGAQHAAVGGQPVLLQRARDAEVGDLGRALVVDEHVLGLDVAVDDVAGVRRPQGAGDLDRVGDGLGDRAGGPGGGSGP